MRLFSHACGASSPMSSWRKWKTREVGVEEWMDVNLEDNTTFDQNKVKEKPKAERSNKKATIIATGNLSAINGEKRKIGDGEKGKGKVRMGAKVGTKVTVPNECGHAAYLSAA